MMYNAVPATGKVSSTASSATPAHRARGSELHLALNRQQASRNRKTETICHSNIAQSSGKWVMRTEAAINFGKSVARA